MVWVLVLVTVIALYLFFISRPGRMVRSTILLAEDARGRLDWHAAVKHFQAAHAEAGRLNEPQKSAVQAELEIQWAGVLYRLGHMAEAEDRLRTGLVNARRHSPAESGFLILGELYWGDICTDMGRYAEAEHHYRQAFAGDEGRGNLAGMIFALQRLGDSLICQGRRGDAEAEIGRAIELETQVVHRQLLSQGKNPTEHPVRSMNQPDLHFCRGEYEEARRLYAEKVAFWVRQATHPEVIDLGRLEMRAAMAAAKTGHPSEAIEMYRYAEATFGREWCAEHPKTVTAREAKDSLVREAEHVG